MQTGARRTALATGLGVLLGVSSRLGDLLPGALAWPFNMGSPWLAVAFMAGAIGCGLWGGAARGAVALVTAVAAYYGYMHYVEGQANLSYLRNIAAPWLGVALVGGPLFGFAGALRRTGSPRARIAAVALLAGALMEESALLLLRPYNLATRAVISLGLVAAVALPWLLLRDRREALAALGLTAGFGVAGAGAMAALLVVLRS